MILALALGLLVADGPIRPPPWPLSPDGDAVAVPGGEPLTVDGGVAERTSAGWWRVLPSPGREAVLLRANDASLSVPVAPSPGRVRVTFDPPAPVKGRDRTVKVHFEVRDPAGGWLASTVPPDVTISEGRLGPLAAGGPGRYEAEWEPSESPRPEVLGIVAIVPRCPLCATPLATGVAILPVAAAIDLPGISDPGVLTRVEIAGRVWGPVRADAEGRFVLPVVVPPGARWAQATSRSALGNEKRTRLDLHLPERPGLLCAAWPRALPADGRAEAGIHCLGWGAEGRRLELGGLRAEARLGTVVGAEVVGDAWRARYRPPPEGDGTDRLVCRWSRGATVASELELRLATGPPASIDWWTDGEPVPVGVGLRARAEARDARGRRIGVASVDGHPLQDDRFPVRSDLGEGVQLVRLAFEQPPGGPAATLALRRSGDDWVAFARDVWQRPVVGVPVRFGSGAEAVTDARGEARGPGARPVETAEAPGGLRAVAWADVPAPIPALTVEREVRIALRPRGTVDVDAFVDGGWIRWKVRGPDGSILTGREVALRSDGVALGQAERVDGGGRCAIRGGKGSVALVDVVSGATIVLEVR